ncbi:hypothetical protein [Aestuariirhabdus haliotis]|uniref:hypothetical protein n=1 Tax=Aestuariirhabdus haliotis TaxID=2918751 RepID=UPI0020BDB909|nr:hypothetical protein [Aestuariirhabdus haliotis]MCL6419453.1 hypothetical protein [Aestuariirhabdus haliotis]
MSAAVTLSRGALALLLKIISTPKQQVDAEGLSITTDFKELLNTRMIHPLQNSATSINIDDQDCELLPCPSGSGYRYFSPGAGWVNVATTSIGKYQVSNNHFLRCVQQWLDISSHQPVAELASDILWDLGDAWFGKSRVAVLFCRRACLAQTISIVKLAFSSFARRRSAVILTDSAISQNGPPIPGEPLCITIHDLLLPDRQCVSAIDKDLLMELLGYGSSHQSKRPPIWCSEDGGELVVNGEQYIFTGLTHKRIIRQLFKAWESGQEKLRTAAVLENAESKASALSQAFSGKDKRWRDVVGYGNGNCWLKTD